jgi:hypothetical protein
MQRGRVVAIGTTAEIIARHPELGTRSLEDVFLALIGQDEGAEP